MKSIILLTFLCLITVGQQRISSQVDPVITLSGEVKNHFGLPVSHCMVNILGTKIKTKTDSHGYFTIASTAQKGILIFQSKGFKTERQAFSASRIRFNIQLRPESRNLKKPCSTLPIIRWSITCVLLTLWEHLFFQVKTSLHLIPRDTILLWKMDSGV